MENEYWKNSPFGKDSIFHPSFDEKQKEKRQNGDVAKITDMYVDRNIPSTFLFFLPKPLPDSPYVPVTVMVNVVVSGYADKVEISLDNGTKRTATRKTGTTEFQHIFTLQVPKSFARKDQYNSKDFTFTATVTDVFQKKVTDTRLIKVRVDTNGKVEESPLLENNCICKRNLTVEEVKNIVKTLRENTFYTAKDPKTKQSVKFKLTNLPYYAPDKIFHRNNTSGKYKSEEVANKSFENFTAQLNNIFEKYDINNCKRRAHFLAQSFIETQYFSQTIESDNNYTSGYDPYRGRGLMHLTHDYNYEKYQKFSQNSVLQNYSLVATNLEISADSAGWYWKFGSVSGNINVIADTKTVKEVTKAINPALFALKSREDAFNILITLFNEKDC